MNNIQIVNKILAVDPGSRYLGIAVMERGQLVHWGVKSIKMNQPPQKRINDAKKIVQKLIDFYQPQVLAIEKPLPHWSEQSKLLDKICEAIKETAKENKVRVREFTPRQIRKNVCGDPKATREEMAKILFMHFPELQVLLDQKKIRDRYWGHLVGAISTTRYFNYS